MPKLLDLFCGAGGCAKGYRDAGFYVVGVDHKAQPRYSGNEFVQSDAFEYVLAHYNEFDVIHASPPCQRFSVITPASHRHNHPDLIAETRRILRATSKPYVIENVENARHHLINPIKLCGSMFGLAVYRHRYFEIYPDILCLTPTCNHSVHAIYVTGTSHRRGKDGKRIEYTVKERSEASGIDWMTSKELDESVPPAYCKWIGEHLLRIILEYVNGSAT